MAELGCSLGLVEKHVNNLSRVCLKASQDLMTIKQELQEVRLSEGEWWTACKAELIRKMVAKYGTYFQCGFEGAVKQFAKRAFPLADYFDEFLDEVAAFNSFALEAFEADSVEFA